MKEGHPTASLLLLVCEGIEPCQVVTLFSPTQRSEIFQTRQGKELTGSACKPHIFQPKKTQVLVFGSVV